MSAEAPLTEMIARLRWQNRQGGILEAWRVIDTPVGEVRGLKDLPFVLVNWPTWTETYRPGGRDVIATALVQYTFGVFTKIESGIPELILAVDKVLNSLQRHADEEGAVDVGLAGTLARPFDTSVGPNVPLDISVYATLTISAVPRPYRMGQR